MSTFLTGDDLNDAIDNIITNAKKFIHITSPYIKLDDHFKERFNLIKNNPSIYLQILFGKNESNFLKSMKSEDLDYFKSFPNVSIIYEPRLHAKSYINESEGIITSMNLYDYSAENNVEYGVVMDRGSVKTTSVTQVVKRKEEIFMSFENLQNNTVFSKTFLFSETIHE